MVSSKRGLDMVKERKILIPHPLKRYLGGWVLLTKRKFARRLKKP
jgi:hypothetical protein